MSRVPHPDFGKHWYMTYILLAICSMPLGYLGWVDWWPVFASYACVYGLGIFTAAENLAKVARSMGFSGTKTSWTYWKIDDSDQPWWADTVRSLLGLWMGLVVLWRLPPGPEAFWGLGWIQVIVGGFFVTWVPYHMVWPKDGPWERFGSWLVTLPGFRDLKNWIDS